MSDSIYWVLERIISRFLFLYYFRIVISLTIYNTRKYNYCLTIYGFSPLYKVIWIACARSQYS